MIRHILLWNYKPETTPEERARLEAELEALPGHVPALRQVGGGPVVGGRHQTRSHGFTMEFDSMDALAAYNTHEAHIHFSVPFRES